MTSLITTTTKSAVHSIFDVVEDFVGGVTRVAGDIKKAFVGGGSSNGGSNATAAAAAATAAAPAPSRRINLLVSSAAVRPGQRNTPTRSSGGSGGSSGSSSAGAHNSSSGSGSASTHAAEAASSTLLRVMAGAPGAARDAAQALGLLVAGDGLAAAVAQRSGSVTPAGGAALLQLAQ
jgi:hypothetical protein